MLRRSSRRRCGGADRRMPKSGSREPEGQPVERQRRSGRRQNQPAEQQPRSGACRKAEAVNPKANPPSGNLRNGRQKNQLAEGNPEAVHAESGSREPEGQLAERQSPKRCVPKSGSSEPEGQLAERKNQPAEGNFQSGRWKNELAQRPLRSGACRKAEAVSPKANPPSGNPETEGDAERRKPPKASVRHPQVEAAKRGVDGAVPTHLPIQSKNAIVTP